MNNGGKNSSYQELFSLNEKEEESGKSITGGQTLSHIFFENSDRGSVPAVTLLPHLRSGKSFLSFKS